MSSRTELELAWASDHAPRSYSYRDTPRPDEALGYVAGLLRQIEANVVRVRDTSAHLRDGFDPAQHLTGGPSAARDAADFHFSCGEIDAACVGLAPIARLCAFEVQANTGAVIDAPKQGEVGTRLATFPLGVDNMRAFIRDLDEQFDLLDLNLPFALGDVGEGVRVEDAKRNGRYSFVADPLLIAMRRATDRIASVLRMV